MKQILKNNEQFENLFKKDKNELMDSLRNKIDPKSQSGNGGTLLYWACRVSNDVDVVKCLVEELGLSVKAVTKGKWSVLHAVFLAPELNFEIFKYLLDKGADINAKTEENWSVLHRALQSETSNFAVIKYLVEKGADINAKTDDDWSVLHRAVKSPISSLELVKYLVENKADINAKTKNCSSVMDLASDSKEIVKYLEEQQQKDINAETNEISLGTDTQIDEASSDIQIKDDKNLESTNISAGEYFMGLFLGGFVACALLGEVAEGLFELEEETN